MVIVTDPYEKALGLSLPRIRADVVTVSHNHPGHNCIKNVQGSPIILSSPGEYEIQGTFIAGIAGGNKEEGELSHENSIFVFEMDGLNTCHLGDLDHIPTREQIEAFGDVQILLIPVGGSGSLSASQAAEVISMLEPQLVIPMHYAIPELQVKLDPVSKLFKEMGLREPAPESSLKVTLSSLPEETQVVLLECKR
jgi:L-ascorbate metabolism protein UlaG (beta-lactamase superfamily)